MDSNNILRNPERLRALWPDVRDLLRPCRGRLLLGMALLALNRASGLVLPWSSKYLVDDVIGRRHMQLLVPLVVAVMAASFVQGTTSFGLMQVLSKAGQRLIAEVRLKLQAHIGQLPVSFYDANKSGELVSRVMHDVEGMRNLIGTGLIDFLGGFITAVMSVFVLVYLSPALAAVVAVFLVVFVLGLRWVFRIIRPIYYERGRIRAEVAGRLAESFSAVRVIKCYHAEKREEATFASGVGRLLAAVVRSLTATSAMNSAAVVLTGAVGASIMFAGAREIGAGRLTLGEFITFTAFLAMLVAPILQVAAIGTSFAEALAGVERAHEVLREKPESADPRRAVAVEHVDGLIEFENVSFAYDGRHPVLTNISFRAEPGAVTALVGPSGAGKSTLIGLVAAFYVPQEGVVRVDGLDLSTLRLDSYRSHLGVVLQDTFLFDGTIRENVTFSKPTATDQEFLTACRLAHVDEFARRLERGYESIVGERGVKLSGGEKQRVSIARAILADPRILILDEATSNLDSESETLIQEGLAFLMRGRTSLVIAHRLSTIRTADQILVLDRGRIVERGAHPSLVAVQGRYFELYTRQFGPATEVHQSEASTGT